MKTCTNCDIESNDFAPHKQTRDGLNSWCRKCTRIKVREYHRTKKGLITRIYSHQRRNSKVRGHKMPLYTKQELKGWLYFQIKFHDLYTLWTFSDYHKDLTPSVDRIDDYEPYSLDNIQLMTWKENREKAYADMKNGVNNKQNKIIIQHDLSGNKITEYHSMQEAERCTGIAHGDISRCCSNKAKTAGGFIWNLK